MTRLPGEKAPVIEKTAAHLAGIRPAYAAILRFYGPVFAAQARAAGDTSPAPVSVDESALQMRRQEGFSLIEPAAFTVDNRAAGKLLAEICRLAGMAGGTLAQAGQALGAAIEAGAAPEGLLEDVLESTGRIRSFAEEQDLPPDMLTLLLTLAVRPSIEAGARRMAEHLNPEADHHGRCPVCGSAPIIGELDADGRQWMHCSLCWHRWPVQRSMCLLCANRRSDSLEYLYGENEPEYRVYLCHACQHYLKVVDTRQLKRAFIPQLEQVVSMHLDMLAADKGFSHAMGAAAATP
jgi:FdhE protein